MTDSIQGICDDMDTYRLMLNYAYKKCKSGCSYKEVCDKLEEAFPEMKKQYRCCCGKQACCLCSLYKDDDESSFKQRINKYKKCITYDNSNT